MMDIRRGRWVAVAIGPLVLGAAAEADVVNLVTSQQGTLNGGIFERASFQPGGTGTLRPFVRIQGNTAITQGYNTSGRPLPFDANNSPNFTRNLTVGEVPRVTIGAAEYLWFVLDINQQGANPLLSLDDVEIYTSTVGSQTTTDVASLGTLRYTMDDGTNNWVVLDYNLGAGSGKGDMNMFIPLANFAGVASSDFLYLYSRFGENFANNAGFEEWAVGAVSPSSPSPVPLPAGAWIGLSGLAIVGLRYAARRRVPG